MTIIVSVKITDGIVMASDSASTFQSGQTYLHADKIVNLVKGLPIGVMVTGNGGIGAESIATLLKDLRARLDGSAAHPWKLDRASYTMQHVAERMREFLFEEKTAPAHLETWMQLRSCGYSAGRPLPEVWEVLIQGKDCGLPKIIRPENDFGVNWDGEYEALGRLILGLGRGIGDAAIKLGMPEEQVPETISRLTNELYRDAGSACHAYSGCHRPSSLPCRNHGRLRALLYPQAAQNRRWPSGDRCDHQVRGLSLGSAATLLHAQSQSGFAAVAHDR